MSNTRHDWISDLSSLSTTIAGLSLKEKLKDELYWDVAKNRLLNKDAYNLSACHQHNEAIARWIDGLEKNGVNASQLTKFLTDLTSRNTYGTFSELAAYGTLCDHDVPFDVQISATGRDIINPNGSDLDGRINLSGGILFDVKAFGFNEHLVDSLIQRLSEDLIQPSANGKLSEFIAVEGSRDVSLELLFDLSGTKYKALKTELAKNKIATRESLEFQLRKASTIQMVTTEISPYRLAEENAAHAFRYAKQFALRKPFLLIFMIHPWLGGNTLHTNFSGYTDTFTRAFARRTFMQFTKDRKTKIFNHTRGAASKLLSGIMFINAWQTENAPEPKEVRLYLNPYAKHPITRYTIDMLRLCSLEVSLDDFAYDTY